MPRVSTSRSTFCGNVRLMDSMFGARACNQPVHFDTRSVKSVAYIFHDAIAFNSAGNFTSTNLVTTFAGMFYGATAFNQPLTFQTGNATDMGGMFLNATSFNQPLNFDTSACISMLQMFYGTSTFNQPINFDTSSLTSAEYMFFNATAFDGTLNFTSTTKLTSTSGRSMGPGGSTSPSFQAENVKSMSMMFVDANQPLDLNMNSVTHVLWAAAFNQPLMESMFAGATAFNSLLNFSSTLNVKIFARCSIMPRISTSLLRLRMRLTWRSCFVARQNLASRSTSTQRATFNQPLINFDTTELINAPFMFYYALKFEQYGEFEVY